MPRTLFILSLTTLLALLSSNPALAQSKKTGKVENLGNTSPFEWVVEKMLDTFVKQMTKTYDLDEGQEKYTRMLTTRRTSRVLAPPALPWL